MADLLLVLFLRSFFGFLQVANAVGAAISELGKWDQMVNMKNILSLQNVCKKLNEASST